jgi:hypothetical protein
MNRNNSFLPLTIQLVLVFFFFIFSIYVLAKVSRIAFRWIRWSAKQSGASTTINFICFALAAYFYPNPLKFVFRQGWSFVADILGNFPNLIQQSSSVEPICGNASFEICLSAVTKVFVASWSFFVLSAINHLRLDEFPLLDSIFFTAIWLGSAYVLTIPNFVERLATGCRSMLDGLTSNYKTISPKFRANALFVGILVIGAYLSFSSIIAIPSLQEAVLQDAAKTDELTKRLKAVVGEPKDFDARFPDISMTLAAKEASESDLKSPAVEDPSRGKEQQTKSDPKKSIEGGASANQTQTNPYFSIFEKNAYRRFAALKSTWTALRENFRSDQFKVIDIATDTFNASNRGRRGTRETEQHFLSIDLWYRHWWAERAATLSNCRAAVEKVGSDMSDLVDLVEANMRSQVSNSSSHDIDISGLVKRQGDSENTARSTCSMSDSVNYDIPLRQDFGGYLGVFGIAAQWLLKTESLPLVLISGLLGFGLLGAACSTFIRNVGNRNPEDPLVVNLAGVILRGASAAIMIFLGVYGGLAVFAGPNVNPNPYVVLFTCLVAAVYSEDAWAWGAKEFRDRLSKSSTPLEPNAPNAGKPTVVESGKVPVVEDAKPAVGAEKPPTDQKPPTT